MATAGKIACPDCSRGCTVSFTIVTMYKGAVKLSSFASCAWCVSRGDRRSIRATSTCDLVILQAAIDRGLLALRLG